MAGNWELDIRAEGTDGSCTMRVLLRGAVEAGAVEVISSCRSVDDLKAEVTRLKGDLDGLLDLAQRKMRAIQSGGLDAGPVDPVQAWKKMEAFASEQDMFNYYNDLSSGDRERIADYVLTQVSMFKGRGPVFSEHYDASTHLLE